MAEHGKKTMPKPGTHKMPPKGHMMSDAAMKKQMGAKPKAKKR